MNLVRSYQSIDPNGELLSNNPYRNDLTANENLPITIWNFLLCRSEAFRSHHQTKNEIDFH